MNILHVIADLNPSHGGPPRVAVRLAAGQAALGHDVTIASYPLDDLANFHEMTRNLPAFERVRIVQLPPGGLRERLFGSNSAPLLRPLIQQADVVHIHNVWQSLNCAAAAEARRADKPYFIESNDMLTPYALSQKRLKKRIALALRYRRMIDNAQGLIFGHSEERRLVQQAKFNTREYVCPLAGVFEQEVEPLPQRGRFYQRFPQLRGRPYALFLSRLHPKKGLDYLAEGFAIAARELPDAQLVVVGHDEGARPDFERRIARHKLADRVHLVGPMHGQDKWEAFRDASCFCLPSRDEAFTVAITEALATGLPVVISKTCHYDDVTEYAAGFTVDLASPEPLGQSLTRLLSDRALRESMSRNALRLFRERLSFNQAARESIAIYEQSLVPSRA